MFSNQEDEFMQNEDVKKLFHGILGVMCSENDDDYQVNRAQMVKFASVVDYAQRLAEQFGGEVTRVNYKPSCEIGAVAVRFDGGDLIIGEDEVSLKDLISALTNCDGMSIEGTGLEDGSFIITFYVNDIHIHK